MADNRGSQTATRQLADFLADLAGGNNPTAPRLRELATSAVLDTLGCIVYGSAQPWTQSAHAYARTAGGPGSSVVIGGANDGGSLTAPMAAFANGCAAHAFELDDVHEEAISHPGAVVVPAALAVGQAEGVSGQRFLDAVVAGYEAMGRAGIAVGPASHMLGGFHPTSMSGVFGAAAATGAVLGFDGDRMNHALGVAATLASGTMEFASSGGMNKRIHAGRAAEGGVLAAMLVADGFEGPADGLAGRYGFCNIFTGAPQVDLLTESLGDRWMLDEITVKPYAACSDIHPMIQAAQELRAEHDLQSEDIVDIKAEGPTKAATQNNMDGTTSVMAAQYSGQFNIAAAILADPADPSTYSPAAIARPELAAMQAKVSSITSADEFDATYAWKMGGRVTITLADGRSLTRTVHGQKGSMHDPLSSEELSTKFTKMCTAVTSQSSAETVRQAVANIGREQDLARLTEALDDL